MGKKVRSPWSYLVYFTVAISLGLLFAAMHNFIFFGWGLLIFIATTSLLVGDLLRATPSPKTTREKLSREIFIMYEYPQ